MSTHANVMINTALFFNEFMEWYVFDTHMSLLHPVWGVWAIFEKLERANVIWYYWVVTYLKFLLSSGIKFKNFNERK